MYFLRASGTILCRSLMRFETSVSVCPRYLHCSQAVTQPLNSIRRGINKSVSPTATPCGGLANVPLGPLPIAVLTSLPTVLPLPLPDCNYLILSLIACKSFCTICRAFASFLSPAIISFCVCCLACSSFLRPSSILAVMAAFVFL